MRYLFNILSGQNMVLKKTKVMVFTTVPTHPQDMGCRRRIYSLLEEFQNQHCEIHIVYFPLRGKREDNISISGMKKKWDKVHVITAHRKRDNKHLFIFSLKGLDYLLGETGQLIKSISPKIYRKLQPINPSVQKITRFRKIVFKNRSPENISDDFVDFYYDQDAFDFVNRISQKEKPDIFICEYALYSFILDAVDNSVLKLIDTHDSIVSFTRLHGGGILNLPDNFIVTKQMEKKLLSRADKAIAIQEEENKYFQSLLGKNKSITIGHKIETKNNLMRTVRKTLLFVGSDWTPNKKGIDWFLKDIWPKILEHDNSVNLIVAGSISKHLRNTKNIQIKGYVKNIEKEYSLSDVVICPIKEGSGLKIKAIESLGYSRPIVGTKHVAEGFGDVVKNKDLFSASDNPTDFANNIIRLLEDDKLYLRRQKNGITFAKIYNREQEKKINQLITLSKKNKNGKK